MVVLEAFSKPLFLISVSRSFTMKRGVNFHFYKVHIPTVAIKTIAENQLHDFLINHSKHSQDRYCFHDYTL